MIKKLPEIQIHSCAKINEKLNEVIDWINDVSALRVTDKQVTANMPNIDVGELAFLSKENSDLKDELEHTRKALDVAKSVLENISSFYKSLILANPVSDINWDVVAKNFAKHSDEALDQIKQITETKGGDNE